MVNSRLNSNQLSTEDYSVSENCTIENCKMKFYRSSLCL